MDNKNNTFSLFPRGTRTCILNIINNKPATA